MPPPHLLPPPPPTSQFFICFISSTHGCCFSCRRTEISWLLCFSLGAGTREERLLRSAFFSRAHALQVMDVPHVKKYSPGDLLHQICGGHGGFSTANLRAVVACLRNFHMSCTGSACPCCFFIAIPPLVLSLPNPLASYAAASTLIFFISCCCG
jgi:hypothetical protein